MKYFIYAGLIVICILFLVFRKADDKHYDQLVWSDEFNEPGQPDQQKWIYDLGDGCPHLCGWGNNELQFYTDKTSNVRVEDGHLVIEGHKEQWKGKGYTSAKLKSKNKGDWDHGKIEIKAKLPEGKGTWPAFWMLPTLTRPMKWPADGEIDIMEHVGFNQGWIFGTIHTKKYNHMVGTQKSDSIFIGNVHDQFHVYGLEWNKTEMEWSVDGKPYHKILKGNDNHDGWPFEEKFHLIVNLAVGGNWGGRHGVDESIWPQKIEIDYVRVYQ